MSLQCKNTLVISLDHLARPTKEITLAQFGFFLVTLMLSMCLCAVVAFPAFLVVFFIQKKLHKNQYFDGGIRLDMGADDRAKFDVLKECSRIANASPLHNSVQDELRELIVHCNHVVK